MEKYNTGYYLSKVNMKDNSVSYDWWKNFFFDQPVKSSMRTYDSIPKIATGREMITQLVVC